MQTVLSCVFAWDSFLCGQYLGVSMGHLVMRTVISCVFPRGHPVMRTVLRYVFPLGHLVMQTVLSCVFPFLNRFLCRRISVLLYKTMRQENNTRYTSRVRIDCETSFVIIVRVILLLVIIVRDATLQITCMYAGCLLYDMNTHISHFFRIFSHYEHLLSRLLQPI